ncbi:Alpha/Beta hydrolase protein [Cladorrhinum sp. PSN259]|nr:Alpha/Beta hydrolase protein [Cladorrhinum sp. PSN259]
MTSHQTARTLYTPPTPTGITFAYRRLGTPSPSSSTPLLILTHFRGVIDKFDPLLTNLLSQSRSLILVDYPGVGLSTGPIATSIKESASHILTFLSLINEKKVDVLGFSLGGMVAQLVALNSPGTGIQVGKLILAGTTPSFGPAVEETPNQEGVSTWAGAKDVGVEAFKVLFFPQTQEGDVAAEAWWDRIFEREEWMKLRGDNSTATWLSQGYKDGAVGLKAQLEQVGKWKSAEGSEGEDGSFGRLGGLDIPVLVVNGADDYMIPTVNSFTMQQRLPNAQLIVYPKSGHGAIFQYASRFARDAISFLEG